MAYSAALGTHLDIKKTTKWVIRYFICPSVSHDANTYCPVCGQCQRRARASRNQVRQSEVSVDVSGINDY